MWNVEGATSIFFAQQSMFDALSLAFSRNIDPVFDWTMDKDGWIRRHGELLVWVPLDLRATLWRPRNTAVLGCAFSTKLDFTNAAIGERWQECFEPPQ